MKVIYLTCANKDTYEADKAPTCGCLACATKWAQTGGELITDADYWDMLNAHDWYYMMSDDGRVYERGRLQQGRLRTMANRRKSWLEMYEGFKNHYVVNGVIGNKPSRPFS